MIRATGKLKCTNVIHKSLVAAGTITITTGVMVMIAATIGKWYIFNIKCNSSGRYDRRDDRRYERYRDERPRNGGYGGYDRRERSPY